MKTKIQKYEKLDVYTKEKRTESDHYNNELHRVLCTPLQKLKLKMNEDFFEEIIEGTYDQLMSDVTKAKLESVRSQLFQLQILLHADIQDAPLFLKRELINRYCGK